MKRVDAISMAGVRTITVAKKEDYPVVSNVQIFHVQAVCWIKSG